MKENSFSPPNVIILLGPTGVGKTAVSLVIARHFQTDIISADSMQIYRGMDIGTAKPSPGELKAVRHHMIDIVEPSEVFSTGRYIERVVPIFTALHKEGKIPLVVGGTGLYIKAMTRGLFTAPEADSSLRDELLAMEKGEPGILYRKLNETDPEAGRRITPGDTRRILRALEVIVKTKRPISQQQKESTRPLPYSFIKIGLTRERRELYSLIDKRVERMFTDGLIGEVEKLLKGNPCYTAMQAIGYKETADYLQGKRGLEETIDTVKQASRRYAKRQYTWFRKEREIEWIYITGTSDDEETARQVIEKIETGLTSVGKGGDS